MKTRMFLAVEPDDNIKSVVDDFIREKTREGIKFVEKENLHITLLFLGEMRHDEIEEVKKSLSFISSFQSFSVKFSGVSAFGNPPRVIYINPISRGLVELGEAIRARLGIDEPFTPHLTIGRVKSRVDISDMLGDRFFGECRITKVMLKKSVLFPSGPIYSDVFKWDLS